MKKILSFLLFVPLLSACYQDLGNYDYKLDTMNEITSVSFTPSNKNTGSKMAAVSFLLYIVLGFVM